MESLETSFVELVRDISEATRRREISETDYQNLLRKIFKEGGPHDSASLWAAVRSRLRADNVLRKIINKAGLCNTAHPDPEVDIERVLGREQEMTELLLRCCNPNEEEIQLSAIPILGPSGIGKTTLARLIYEDELVLKHFEIRVWVKADGHDFTLHHAAQKILKSTMHMSCSIDGLNELDEMVRDTLQGRRCLIVFDGVGSMTNDVWHHMKKLWFDFVDLGSVVLLTTPSQRVANLVSNEQPFELKPLSQYARLSLCRQVLLVSSDFEEDMVKNLDALCGYIPLLLKLVGSMMMYDDNLRHLLSKVHFSAVIYSLPNSDASVAILLCVWALPPQLRQCLAFYANFPQGYALDREKIINMWVAHGLVKTSRKKNQKDIGDSYFHQLLSRSFFTDISRNGYGDITDFRMPGLIHTIMQDVAAIVWKEKVGVIGSISEDAHLTSLHSQVPEDVTTLILSSTLHSGVISLDYTFLAFQELQSLDLSCSGIRNLSEDVCALRELKYLNLSYTLIETLPDSIAGLPRLQTLDLSWCYHFKVLPKAIRNMTYMSHLELFQCESLSYLPSGIGLLVSLTSMPLFVLGKDHDSARLGELGPLNQLRGRLEIRNLENVMEISEARDANLNQKKFHHLGLGWSKDAVDCFEVLELLKPNRQLKVVDITGYMGTRFPGWISSMSSLIKISITDCGCRRLPSLGKLPLLKELQLKGMTNIEYIGREFYGDGVTGAFPSLEQLGLYDMPNLVVWSVAMEFGEVCRSLKTLTIEGCPQLLEIPTFRNLLDLIICNSNHRLLSFWKQTRFGTPSSLLIKNMELGIFLEDTTVRHSLKKFILFNITQYSVYSYFTMSNFTELEHLGIAHCPQVRDIELISINSIQKLHVVDCPNLEKIYFRQESTTLTELVVDGCPELHYVEPIHEYCWLTKLIIGGSDKFISGRDFIELKKLQYLSITECPRLERELEMKPSLISHIPCVLLSNRKVQSKYSELDGVSTLFELEHDS